MDLPVRETMARRKKRQQSFNRKVVYLVESLLVYILEKKVIHAAASQIAVQTPSLAVHSSSQFRGRLCHTDAMPSH